MNETFWMTPKQMEKYLKLSTELQDLEKDHHRLMKKLKAKTILQEEVQELRTIIDRINKLHLRRRALLAQNPFLIKNILKALKQQQSR